MRHTFAVAATALTALVSALIALVVVHPPAPPPVVSPPSPQVHTIDHDPSVLQNNLLVTWYGSPWTGRMGVLGRYTGEALADGLKRQADAYRQVTHKGILSAYELIAVVAQPQPGADGRYRRRESREVIERTLRNARAAGFKLVLDIQTGRSTVMPELAYLAPYLAEPDVYLALDPEFSMGSDGVPGRRIGTMGANEINDAIAVLEWMMAKRHLPPKVLIVHQFTTGMLPDKDRIWTSSGLDIVLDMDGFGSPELKRHSYRTVLRQRELEFTGFKLFYIQDTNMLEPSQVLALTPQPSVVIYQ